MHPPPNPTPYPYTTLFRSSGKPRRWQRAPWPSAWPCSPPAAGAHGDRPPRSPASSLGRPPSASPTTSHPPERSRSEEHTSELQSHVNLVCRLLLEKKKVTH